MRFDFGPTITAYNAMEATVYINPNVNMMEYATIQRPANESFQTTICQVVNHAGITMSERNDKHVMDSIYYMDQVYYMIEYNIAEEMVHEICLRLICSNRTIFNAPRRLTARRICSKLVVLVTTTSNSTISERTDDKL